MKINDHKSHYLKNKRYQEFLRFNVLAFIFIAVILAILFIKYLTLSKQDTVAYLYSICVTVFVLTRITASFFYNNDKKWKNNNYEPTVSFVIPVKNEENVIADTIAKCYDVNYPRDKIEVVVINDGSTDRTLIEIEKMKEIYPGLTVIDWKINKGKRYAMAEGFIKAKGDILIQLDSDSYIEKDSLKILVQPFQDANIGAVAAHTDPRNIDENFLTKMQAAYYFISFRAMKAYESMLDMVFCCSGCCSAYRKTIVLPILDIWKDETFLSRPVSFGDDRSLTNLLLKSGYKTIYLDKVQAYTIVPNNIRQFTKQQIRWKKSWIINAVKLSKFILKKDKFVAITYFFPLVIISLVTPFIAFKALILNPLIFGIIPIFYISGVILITCLLALHYQFFRNDKNWKYIFAWTFLGVVFTSYLMFYALLDIRNMKWGTR
ncbi:Dolichyl N-acetyl-alpha-D-glucosaminyl phosphate 3-beta-D-2,3-diacetamido-2,3-dideoxy-beta-D-glucuronosyltransferase [uncultured archaeon]|nr:Dolichyl N-acetyl-alpha-D-glucosaminyl phosphate 3-beta-D-2,3-diacetamido-2,3-dideoxy-beta-D-glucuronosyltransferase [uncultured archaeon]